MSKHTPGEWKVDERASLRVHHDYKTIASCGGYVASENAEEAEANAKLIAAAPDLLEALQALLKSFDEIIPTPEELGTSVPTALLKAQAAIKKATN